jgi:gluconolactonase
MSGGGAVAGFNAPNRVVLTTDAEPGRTHTVAIFGINGPISVSPQNYIWIRSATLQLYRAGVLPPTEPVGSSGRAERVATGFGSLTGAVWMDGGLLMCDVARNTVFRWTPLGDVDVARSNSGAATALALDADGRLLIAGAGRLLRVEPRGNVTTLADGLDSPNAVAVHRDGTVFVADVTGVKMLHDGVIRHVGGPPVGGLAVSPADNRLYATSGTSILALDLNDDASPSVVATLNATLSGLAVDSDGLYICADRGVTVLDQNGTMLETIELSDTPRAIVVGGDGRTYVTSNEAVYRISTRA